MIRYHTWSLEGSWQGEGGDRLPRELFQMDVCTYVTWIYPGVALLASIARLQKFVLMHLNFDPDGSSERMASWIEQILFTNIVLFVLEDVDV